MLNTTFQEEGDRKTNLIVNYLPQTMTQVVRILNLLTKVVVVPWDQQAIHTYVPTNKFRR